MSVGRGVDKEDAARIHSGILLGHRKEWNDAICSNVDGPRKCHIERSESDREGKRSQGIPYMWNLKRHDTKELTQTEKERDRKASLICGIWKDMIQMNLLRQRRREIARHPLYVESEKTWYKWTYSEKERDRKASLICGIWKDMIQMNLLSKQEPTHRLREWTYSC